MNTVAAASPAATFTQEALDATRPPAPSHGLGVGFRGIYATLDDGEVVHAIVEDAAEFADQFGELATHTRALEIAHMLNDGTSFHGTGLLGGWEDAVAEAIEEARAEFLADRAGGE